MCPHYWKLFGESSVMECWGYYREANVRELCFVTHCLLWLLQIDGDGSFVFLYLWLPGETYMLSSLVMSLAIHCVIIQPGGSGIIDSLVLWPVLVTES